MTTLSSIWCQFWKNLNQVIQSSTEHITTEEFYVINTIACLANHLDITLMDENYQLLPNINIEKLLNKVMTYSLNHVEYSTLETLILTCGSLVCIKEFSSFSTNDAQTLIALISLPWLGCSNNVFKSLPSYNYLNIIMNKYSDLLSKSSCATKLIKCQ